jgi:diguanylate cyclase (GGDEF)-like protein
MAYPIATRITLNLVAGIIITVATVLITIFWMAQKHNEQAARSTETMVVGGVQAMGKRIQQLANDYSWWEEAYDAYVRGDTQWIDANVGTGITDTRIADLLVIISPKGTVDYQWIIDDAPNKANEVITPEILSEIHKIADTMSVGNYAAQTGYIKTPAVPMMLAFQHLTPVSRADTSKGADLPIIVFGQYLSDQRLHDLGKSFLIDDLHFVTADAVNDPQIAVNDIDGRTVGRFDWTPPMPGYALLKSVLLPIIVALSLFCVVALTTAFRARKLAVALADSEAQAVTAARTDIMTGLMNRTGFNELIESPAIQAACAEGHLAVVYLDINGFKAVNDSIGHHGGDELVKALTDRITSVLPSDTVFARIGGDEFAVAMVGKSARDTAAGAASAVVHSLDQPFTVHGFEFHVTASVGFAVAGGTGLTPSEIIRRADLAMYQAKNAAEREAIAYHSTMETGALEKKQVETALRRAIEEGDLRVFYQPVVRASDLTVVGLEALVRWTSKEFGTVSPALFIPVAEDTGLIHDIGRIVIDRACQDLVNWPSLRMAINISPVQLRDPNFANDLVAIVERYDLSPRQFELELTEGILVNNPTIAKRKLATLKDLGFILSLDDFGTGFSSIGYLRQFPFDILKVDRSFVRDIGLNATANALIQSLVSLGDAMDLSVIAEGIENDEQLKLLRLVQCEYVQGFLISRPVPAEEITALLKSIGEEKRITIGAGPIRDRMVAATAQA